MSSQSTLLKPAAPYRRLTPTIWQCTGRTVWRSLVAVWQTLELIGQRRAVRELLAMAERAEPHDPEYARQLRISAHFGSMT